MQNKLYSTIINFFDEDNNFDYQKIKSLVDYNVKQGQNKFYLRAHNFDYCCLSFEAKKDYYKKIIDLIPIGSELLLEAKLDFLINNQEIINTLAQSQNNFDLIFKTPTIREKNSKSYFESYRKYLSSLTLHSKQKFYLDLNTGLIDIIDIEKLIEASTEFKKLKGFIINPVYPYDLDFKEFSQIKTYYSKNFEFLDKAADFYFLNLSLGVKTISKYFNLVPNLFKQIFREFENNNIEQAKKYQLILNDFITKINDYGSEASFKYLLAKALNFDFKAQNKLSKIEKLDLEAEFDKINGYIVDKV